MGAAGATPACDRPGLPLLWRIARTVVVIALLPIIVTGSALYLIVLLLLAAVAAPVFGACWCYHWAMAPHRERRLRGMLRINGRTLTPDEATVRVRTRGGTLLFEEGWGFRPCRLWWTPDAVPAVPDEAPRPARPRAPEGEDQAWDDEAGRLFEEWVAPQREICRRYFDPRSGSAFLVETEEPDRLAEEMGHRARELLIVHISTHLVELAGDSPRANRS